MLEEMLSKKDDVESQLDAGLKREYEGRQGRD